MSVGTARIAIDRGGTFTDVICSRPNQEDIVFKLLSVDPQNYPDAPREGIRRILNHINEKQIGKDELIPLDQIESIRMGTTVSTNALLERNGEKCALVTTKGHGDVLEIGVQARPDIFDLSVHKLSLLYDDVVEIDERITPFQSIVSPQKEVPENSSFTSDTSTGETIQILRRPHPDTVSKQLDQLKVKGIHSVAIALVHSYLWPKHEEIVAEIAKSKGFSVSISHELQPQIKIIARANSAVADSYLTPVTRRYIESFGSGFQGGVEAFGDKLLFMQSDGGLCQWNKFSGLRAILSGPAGGVIGYSRTCYDAAEGRPLIAVDMGGTSTDVSRFAGKLDHVFETTTAEVIIQAPQLDINTVAAGGGSRLFYRHGMFVVGPESATAHPGPACYRKGGPLAITDANLVLGRLLPEHFPKIFGPNEDEGLDIQASKTAFHELTRKINEAKDDKMTLEEVASGYLRVANEAMCRPIRILTEARGFECNAHHLVMFGGAGGQHACSIAKTLNIRRIIIPCYSSLLSAHGIALADVVRDIQEPAALKISGNANKSQIEERLQGLAAKARADLRDQGYPDDRIDVETFINCRYQGTSTKMMIETPVDKDYETSFFDEHKREFGFNLEQRDILVDDLRVRATGKSIGTETRSPYVDFENADKRPAQGNFGTKDVYFDDGGWKASSLVPLANLKFGEQVIGPAIIYDQTQTLLVEPDYIATALPEHVVIDLATKKHIAKLDVSQKDYTNVDPVLLSVYGHRLMGIAEQMGDILRKISISINIKERLDYSCAIFSADGGLVANAPHVPVHLGAMSHAVKYQAKLHSDSLETGDVLLSNHPAAGGSHLPDLTVIMPAFHEGKIIFWTAARAHHADIGGIRPGSMPPFSKELWEEGAQVKSFKLVKRGEFDEAGVIRILSEQPAQYPGCVGTRTLSDNISDLHAQIAACNRGVVLIQALVNEQSLDVVDFFMHAIMHTAERAVRDLLRHVNRKFGGKPLEAIDWLDDGTQLVLKLTIDEEDGSAVFDFTGTSPQIHGNLNTPTAILYSAIIYVLRSLIVSDLPLNQGCLAPIKLIIPAESLLSPTDEVAVCAGNVEGSQRVTDVILKAFQACAASQGGCNNLTFGAGPREIDGKKVDGFGYYETIAGGAGAGPDWNGQNCVQVHMTNTAIGDVETTERIYPVVIHEYSRRYGSGGKGRNAGGDGCIRDIQFTEELDVAILSQRRVIAPYGMAGGDSGVCGSNYWLKETHSGFTKISLGGMNQTKMKAGDHIVINTPGGGGYGVAGTIDDRLDDEVYKRSMVAPVRASGSLASFQAAQLSN